MKEAVKDTLVVTGAFFLILAYSLFLLAGLALPVVAVWYLVTH